MPGAVLARHHAFQELPKVGAVGIGITGLVFGEMRGSILIVIGIGTAIAFWHLSQI